MGVAGGGATEWGVTRPYLPPPSPPKNWLQLPRRVQRGWPTRRRGQKEGPHRRAGKSTIQHKANSADTRGGGQPFFGANSLSTQEEAKFLICQLGVCKNEGRQTMGGPLAIVSRLVEPIQRRVFNGIRSPPPFYNLMIQPRNFITFTLTSQNPKARYRWDPPPTQWPTI